MKTILLVTKEHSVHDMYYSELKKVIGDNVQILTCDDPGDGSDFSPKCGIEQADLVLLTNPYSFPKARRLMSPDATILNLEFAFDKKRIEALKRFPIGTEAVACFNFYSSAHLAVNILYGVGVTNLNLYPHYPGNKNLVNKKLDLVITAGQTHYIPEDIPKRFDLGNRKISLSTLMGIAVHLNILDNDLESKIIRYCEDISLPDSFLSHFYDTSAITTLQLKTIMECIDYGILIFDNKQRIINYNQNFASLLDWPDELYGKSISEFCKEKEFQNIIFAKEEFRNKLYTFQNQRKSYIVSKQRLNKSDTPSNVYILLIKDITDLTNLETSLRRQIAKRGHIAKYAFNDIKKSSKLMERCVEKAKRIAPIEKPTLIMGESGTGKELFAQSIHNASQRAKFPFVAMNCAAIPPTLLESELFGYEEGAFTGARKGGKEGLFQMAQKGTLFLDEISELTLPTQAKLLRVLEEKEIMKLGGEELIDVDARIIAATNRDLNASVEKGEFRLDLYYRLNTLIINIPPLRDRREDIPTLIEEFLKHENQQITDIHSDVMQFLMLYNWKGNVRELKNCIEYMSSISDGSISMKDLPDYMLRNGDSHQSKNISQFNDYNLINPFDRKVVFQIMRSLMYTPLGRSSILQLLAKEDIIITEYHLRSLLYRLQSMGYLTIKKGRKGCVITTLGHHFLNHIEEEGWNQT